MVYLNETTLQDSLKDLKPNDVLRVVTHEKTDFNVVNNSGEELIVNGNGEEFLLRKNAFQDDKLTFFKKSPNGKWSVKGTLKGVKFMSHVRGGNVVNTITNSETDKDIEAKKKNLLLQLKKQVENKKFKFIKNIQDLSVGDSLKMFVGKTKSDGSVDKNDITIITFTVMGEPNKNEFYLEFIKVDGPQSDSFTYLGKVDLLELSLKSPIISSHGEAITIRLFSKNKKIAKIENVTHLEHFEVDNAITITKDDILNNPYYRNAMIKDASWLDKLFGNNKPKGIIPAMEKIGRSKGVSKVKGKGKIKVNQKIQFVFIGDDIGSGDDKIEANIKYSAKVLKGFTFKIGLVNKGYTSYAKFKIISKSKIDSNMFNVEVTITKNLKTGINVYNDEYKGKIIIKDYNH